MKIQFNPVGVTFYSKDVAKLKENQELTFEHRPVFFGSGENKKEYPNAVAVLRKGVQVGSLAESDHPQSPQQRILKNLDAVGYVVEVIKPSEDDSFKRTFKIEVELPDESKQIMSFNEDIMIDFDENTI